MPKKQAAPAPDALASAALKRGRGRPKKGQEPVLSSLPLPSSPQPSMGLDIGVEGFHLCLPVPGTDVREWPVWFIRYEGNPHWRKQLAAMLGEQTICPAEPNGWNHPRRCLYQFSPYRGSPYLGKMLFEGSVFSNLALVSKQV